MQQSENPQLVFLDTEFSDWVDRELISIGIVSEDARHQFYGEVSDFDSTRCSPFVRTEVLPLLGQTSNASVKRVELGTRLRSWFAELAVPVTIACDYSADWDLLVSALDGEPPANVIGRLNLANMAKSATFTLAAAGYHAGAGRPWHHALHDAYASRVGWLAWTCNDLQAQLPNTDRRGRRHYVEIADIPNPYRDQFAAWLARNRKLEQGAPASAVRRSAWREWLLFRFSTIER